MLIDEDQEDVIRMARKALRLNKRSLRPKWYFAAREPWVPGSDKKSG